MELNNKLDFNKYRDRLKKIYPKLKEEELKEIFWLRIEYWEMILEFY